MTKNKFIILSTFFLIHVPILAHAFSAEVLIDTGGENINALEATIHIPQGINIEEVYSGNSAILFWIQTPTYDKQSQTISFSGITPGGFSGKEVVLSFSGEFGPEDLSNFSFSGISALKNDGEGTAVPVELALISAEIEEDQISPEPFTPIISSVPEMFDGRRFLSFATQDKGTGIRRYEYASTWLLAPNSDSWLEAESPVVLSQAMLFQKIYVRAVDGSGNTRTTSIAGPYHYASLILGIIILLCALFFSRWYMRPSSSRP